MLKNDDITIKYNIKPFCNLLENGKIIENLEKEFEGNGRVLIRPSGTEPLVRVMIEGENQEYIEEKAKTLAKLIEENCK